MWNIILTKMSKKVISITEEQLGKMLTEASMANIYNPYSNQVKDDKKAVSDMLLSYGKVMINIENSKYYQVYYLQSISQALGKDYVMCRALGNNNEALGAIYVKPLSLFRDKYSYS